MENLRNISIVLPSLDPDEKLSAVIDGLLDVGFTDIILVNDGSKPENLHYFEEAAILPQVQLLHHEVNRGKGAALKTAFEWFLQNRPEGCGVVTVDGDNQHHPEDTLACTLEMINSGKVILGCRDFSLDHVPARSRFGNNATCTVFRLFCGMKISDTQTGLRAIPRSAMETFCKVKGDRFEYETNMLLALKEHGIPYGEVKIRTVYIEENKSSHFRAVRDSVRIYSLIFNHFFRYTASSLFSSTVDTVVFFLLTWLLGSFLGEFWLAAVATGSARVISSLTNFFLNKKLVFHSHGSTGKALLRYCCLVIPVALLQMGMNYGACLLLGIGDEQVLLRTVVHVVVMMILYVVNFIFQERWVFGAGSKERN